MDGETGTHARTLTHTQMRLACSVQTIYEIAVFLHGDRNNTLCRSLYGLKWYLYM